MPKILITGSNGLLGEHLISLLKNRKGWNLVATGRGKNRLKNKEGYEYRKMDILREKEVNTVIKEINPDFIIHAAAMTQVDKCEEEKEICWKTNLEATGYLMRAAQKNNAFFIFISTDFIFNGEKGPYHEDALPDPLSYYGMSKLAAEMLLKGGNSPHVILRTVLVYGVSEDSSRSNLVLWVKKSLEDGKVIHVVEDQWRTPTLVQDLAMGCKLVIDKKLADAKLDSIYNISGKEILTPYQMALKTADYFELDDKLVQRADASTFTQKATRPPRTGFLLDAAERDLNYRPHTFEEGLAVVKEKLKQRG